MREELAWAAMKSFTEDILNLSSLVENQMMSGAQVLVCAENINWGIISI